MGKRKVRILDTASIAVAEIAFFIEGKGLPQTAKKFVDEAFKFFDRLSDSVLEHKPCMYEPWRELEYRCVPYKKKYTVAYLSKDKEIVICEFISSKLIHW
jgi:plasmid stabilization system protein ParE